jgi:hypothetical protein
MLGFVQSYKYSSISHTFSISLKHNTLILPQVTRLASGLSLIKMLPLFASAALAGLLASQTYASPVDLGGLGLDSVTDVLGGLNLDSATSGLSGTTPNVESSSSAVKNKTTPVSTASSVPHKRDDLDLNILPTFETSPVDLASLVASLDTSPLKKRSPPGISLEQGLIPLIPGVTEPLTTDASIPLPILQLPLPPLDSPPFTPSNIKPKKIGYFWTGSGDNQHKDFLVTTSLDDVSSKPRLYFSLILTLTSRTHSAPSSRLRMCPPAETLPIILALAWMAKLSLVVVSCLCSRLRTRHFTLIPLTFTVLHLRRAIGESLDQLLTRSVPSQMGNIPYLLHLTSCL